MEEEGEKFSLLQDIKCGAMAGIIMVLSSHPLDTIKVRMQMDSNLTMIGTTKSIILKEGFLSLYKGVSTAIFASFPISAVTFCAYEIYLKDILKQRQEEIYFKQWIVAGAFAGMVQSFFTCPSELIKTVLQMQFEYQQKQFKNPIDCIIQFTRQQGIKSLYKGLIAVMIRDIPQFSAFKVFFTSYEGSKLFIKQKKRNQSLNLYEQILAGSFAGLSCITVSYPMDIVKTMIQCEITTRPHLRKFKSKFYDGGWFSCVRGIYSSNGLRGFWIGYDSCALYYITACCSQLVTYDLLKSYYTNQNKRNLE